jgi:hypothetical protein
VTAGGAVHPSYRVTADRPADATRQGEFGRRRQELLGKMARGEVGGNIGRGRRLRRIGGCLPAFSYRTQVLRHDSSSAAYLEGSYAGKDDPRVSWPRSVVAAALVVLASLCFLEEQAHDARLSLRTGLIVPSGKELFFFDIALDWHLHQEQG